MEVNEEGLGATLHIQDMARAKIPEWQKALCDWGAER